MEMSILYWIQNIHSSLLDSIMIFITSLGNAGIIWIVLAIIFLFTKKYRKCGIAMALALLLSFIFGNVILKNLFERPRPSWVDTSIALLIKNPRDYSFPSGHSFASFAGATAIFIYHKKEGIAALILAALIAFSRLYLFVHYPSDVILGSIFGVTVALVASKAVNLWVKDDLLSRNRSK